MSQKELNECQREVVLVHKRWKAAVTANETLLATNLDAECRQLRKRIVAAKQIGHGNDSTD